MGFNIAVAGKGGTGKTTIAGLAIRYLTEKKGKRVLGVDADPNMNLNDVLGVCMRQTIGQIREGLGSTVPAGMTKDSYINYKTQECLVEAEKFDLIAMGRPEGAGCYCYANTLCKKYIDEIAGSYAYVVLDNEAGMEHLSRRTTHNMDVMFLVADSSARGIQAAGRIKTLVEEIDLTIGKLALIINRVDGELGEATLSEISATGLELAGIIPSDAAIAQYDVEGRPTFELPEDSQAIVALNSILDKYIPA